MNYKKEKETLFIVALVSFVISFFIGAAAFFLVDKKMPMSADRILNNIKRQFKDDGPIEGSWIEMTKVPWEKFSYQTDVYYGGISRFEKGEITQYEFIADAYTGSIVDLYKI